MILTFKQEISDDLPEETQMQIAAQLINDSVGKTLEIVDPLRMEEGDRKLVVLFPLVTYLDTSDYVLKYLQGVLEERVAELHRNGPVI